MRKQPFSFKSKGSYKHSSRRVLSSLKFTTLSMMLSMSALTMNVQAQEVSVSVKNGNVKTVLESIAKQTGMSLAYSPEVVDFDRKISIDIQKQDVTNVLNNIFENSLVGYEIKNNKIYLFTKNETSSSRDQEVKGVVIDNYGNPVIGASILNKRAQSGTITGLDGDFTLQDLRKGDVIVISFIGYKTEEVIWKGQALKIVLKEDTELLDEVIVVGYGTTSKRKTTSAVSQIKSEELSKVPVPNVTQSLAGRSPGLIVQQNGGGVNAKASISIRGGGTPLYVIDGIICEERDFQNLNPEDIDQMSVLKDASATAIYGARAANGIIMVTTKMGETGKINVDYNFNYTLSQPADLAKKVDAFTAASFVNRGLMYDGRAPQYSDEDLRLYQDGTDPYGHANTDWQDVTMRNFAPEQRHNLSLSGGSETMKIYSAIGMYDQGSIYRTNSNTMRRYNFRTNMEANLISIGLKITTGVEAYLVDTKEPATSKGSGYNEVWSHIQNKRPMEPAYNPLGQIYSGTTDNPLLDISDRGGYYRAKESSVRANLNLEWSVPWVKGLTLKGLGSYTLANDRYKSWNKTAPAYDWDGNIATSGMPSLSKSADHHSNFNVQFLAEYDKQIKDHHFAATFGLEASGSDYDNLWAQRKDYIFDVDQMGAGPSSTMENSSSEFVGERRAAVIGRITYDYKSRYMAEFNIRHDGSDYFPENNRWGNFFSGSLAWNISDESFWKNWNFDKAFEQFKIRASYGEIGQDSGINRYAYLTSYDLDQRGAFIGGSWVPTFSEGNLVSPDITWYTTKDLNIGIDFASLKSRLSGSVDYFSKITTGYLASPSNVGYTSPLGKGLPHIKTNGESIRRGFEFVLQWKDNIGDLQYGISGNMTVYDDRWNINPYEAESSLKNPYKRDTQVGSYTGNYYKNLGFYKDYLDVMNSPKRNGSTNLLAGDLKYYDFNGDGKIDGDDQFRRGDGNSPRANYGIALDLNYKGWFLNMLWQGATNYNIYIDSILQGGNSDYLPIIYEFQKDIWAPDNIDAIYPRQHSYAGFNGNNNFVGTDFWLVDARYIRLKNLSIGYDLKHKLLRNVTWLSKCSLSLAGYNLLTFSPAKKYGFDPESGSGSGYTYPVSRVYTVSLNIGF